MVHMSEKLIEPRNYDDMEGRHMEIDRVGTNRPISLSHLETSYGLFICNFGRSE